MIYPGILNKSLELQKVTDDIIEKAVRRANRAVRKQLLSGTVKSFFTTRLVDILGSNLETLKMIWNPFQANRNVASGFGMTLMVADPLVRQLMIDQDLYDKAEEIAIEAMEEELYDNFAPFLEAVFDDLINDQSFFEIEQV